MSYLKVLTNSVMVSKLWWTLIFLRLPRMHLKPGREPLQLLPMLESFSSLNFLKLQRFDLSRTDFTSLKLKRVQFRSVKNLRFSRLPDTIEDSEVQVSVLGPWLASKKKTVT